MNDSVKCPNCDYEGVSAHALAIHRGMMKDESHKTL